MSQLQCRNENQNFISNSYFNLLRKQEKKKRNNSLGTRIRFIHIFQIFLRVDFLFYYHDKNGSI